MTTELTTTEPFVQSRGMFFVYTILYSNMASSRIPVLDSVNTVDLTIATLGVRN